MNDKDKTIKQFEAEAAELRQKIEELEDYKSRYYHLEKELEKREKRFHSMIRPSASMMGFHVWMNASPALGKRRLSVAMERPAVSGTLRLPRGPLSASRKNT